MGRTAAVLGGASHHLCSAGLAKVESRSDTAAIVCYFLATIGAVLGSRTGVLFWGGTFVEVI